MEMDEFALAVRQKFRELDPGMLAKYDQNISQYRSSFEHLTQMADEIFHAVGEDMVIPYVGAALSDILENVPREQAIVNLQALLGVAVLDAINTAHEVKKLVQLIPGTDAE